MVLPEDYGPPLEDYDPTLFFALCVHVHGLCIMRLCLVSELAGIYLGCVGIWELFGMEWVVCVCSVALEYYRTEN